MTDLARLTVALEAQSAQFTKELEKVNKRLDNFSSRATKALAGIRRSFNTAFAGLATFASVRAFSGAINGAIDAADAINDMSQQLGISTEQLSAFQYAANSSGTSIEALNSSLVIFSKNIAQALGGSSKAAEKFRAIGISISDLKSQSLDQLFVKAADSFSKYEDGAQKAALATQFFGKSGADLIPLLNEGAKGLSEFEVQARQLGITLSGETAKAADEFNDRAATLHLINQSIFRQIAAGMLPALNQLANVLVGTARDTDGLTSAGRVLGNILKGLAASGIIVSSIFSAVGDTLGGVAAAVVQAVQGNFKDALNILKDPGNLPDISKRLGRVFDLFDETSRKFESSAGPAGKRIAAPIISAAKETDKAAKKIEQALKSLKDFNVGLETQIATFDRADNEIIKYRLAFGDLSDEIKLTGAAGEKLAAQIQKNADALQRLQDTKAIEEGLVGINAQLERFSGHDAAAALIEFDQSMKTLRETMVRAGDTDGLVRVAQLREAINAQEEFNRLQKEASKIQSDLAIAEERIRNEQEVGAISELEALKRLGDERTRSVEQLRVIEEQLQAIAAATNNPELINSVKQFAAEIDSLAIHADLLAQKFTTVLKDSFADSLASVIDGTKSIKDAFRDLISNIEQQLSRIAAQQIAEQIFGSGGAGGGIGSFIASLFTPKALGGPVAAGNPYLVGERGPELFVPDTSGSIVPNAKMGGDIHIHTTVVAPRGRVESQSLSQMQTLIGLSTQRALARNA